ncbi:helix loop helix DNA-binding domain protein [Medicago truncatula]|uniref:Helix loop helix DNA-binding domain protein n=1 Tax=Medicago truncatula TaxID=3880 RepID=A0A072VBG7_MEDTR|nr:helix loop helix DNA-binding domain protein [Medicago truncatula]
MDQNQQGGRPSSSTKVERKIVEKNRRNQMKILFSKLNSLLPSYNQKELALPLPDQVDEAINYIKSLEINIKLAKEKKESLMGNKKRSRGGWSSSYGAKGSIELPKIEIHEIGPTLQVIVTCGVDEHFIFCEIMRILHEENVDVISSNSSLAGDSLLHTVLAQIPQSLLQFGETKISKRLKAFVDGSMSDVETDPQLWDLEIGIALRSRESPIEFAELHEKPMDFDRLLHREEPTMSYIFSSCYCKCSNKILRPTTSAKTDLIILQEIASKSRVILREMEAKQKLTQLLANMHHIILTGSLTEGHLITLLKIFSISLWLIPTPAQTKS